VNNSIGVVSAGRPSQTPWGRGARTWKAIYTNDVTRDGGGAEVRDARIV